MSTLVFDVIAIVLATAVVIWGTVIVHTIRKYLKRKLDIAEYEVNLNFNTEGIQENLDILIQNCIDEYMAINLAFRDDIYYINEQIQDEIREKVSDMVSKRLNPAYIQKLSTIYNSESLYEIVGQRIYLAVTAYVVQYNSGKGPTP